MNWTMPPATSYKERKESLNEYKDLLNTYMELAKMNEKALTERLLSEQTNMVVTPIVNTPEEEQNLFEYKLNELKLDLESLENLNINADDLNRINDLFSTIYNSQDLSSVLSNWDFIERNVDQPNLTLNNFLTFIEILITQLKTNNYAPMTDLQKANVIRKYRIATGQIAVIPPEEEEQEQHQIEQEIEPVQQEQEQEFERPEPIRIADGLKKRRICRPKLGHGIPANNSPRYLEFGKYCIHKDSLKHNILNVKYKSSFCSVPFLERQHVTSNFVDLLMNMIETHQFNPRLHNRLSKDEKHLFYNLIVKSELEDLLEGSGMKLYDEDHMKDEERFELLKGSIMAGNNSPDVLREIKVLVLKFLANGKMKRNDAYKLLSELTLLL